MQQCGRRGIETAPVVETGQEIRLRSVSEFPNQQFPFPHQSAGKRNPFCRQQDHHSDQHRKHRHCSDQQFEQETGTQGKRVATRADVVERETDAALPQSSPVVLQARPSVQHQARRLRLSRGNLARRMRKPSAVKGEIKILESPDRTCILK